MRLNSLNQLLNSEPSYRLTQIKQAVFCDLIQNWDEAMTLPLALRQKLNQICPLEIKHKIFLSRDHRSAKALIHWDDGHKIETVLMKHNDGRCTACVSAQIGCPLACAFCATGQMGFKRNLTAGEIAAQVILWNRYLKSCQEPLVNHLVFMGMGEPFLNYPEVMAAIRAIHDPDGLNLGARKISISTVGIIPGINQLAEEALPVNLAISLHAPNDQLRARLMPVNKKYSIKPILAAVDNYLAKTNRRVMFEYLMINRVNDSLAEAKQLAALMRHPLYLVNLIAYNPTGPYKSSPRSKIAQFKQFLEDAGLKVTERCRFGADIQAACGQLAGRA